MSSQLYLSSVKPNHNQRNNKMNRNVLLISIMLIMVHESLCSENPKNKVNESEESTSRGYKYNSDLKYLYNTYQECSSSELSSCLKLKLIEVVDRVARFKSDIKLVDGVTFVKDKDSQEENMVSVDEIKDQLPRSIGDKERALSNMLFDRVMSFFKSHTLQVSETSEIFVCRYKR